MDHTSISIGLGLAVSVVLTELFGLVAGGMVTPGYLALYLNRPVVVANTLLAAAITWLIVHALSRRIIVYGRRRTALMILVGFLIGFAIRAAGDFATAHAGGVTWPADLTIVGFIIPGLIAIWIERQGFVETNAVVLTASAIVRLLLIATGMEFMS